MHSDFMHSLEYITTAPPLVFERLVANVVNALKANTPSPSSTTAPPTINAAAAPPEQPPSSPQANLPTARHYPSLGTSTLRSQTRDPPAVHHVVLARPPPTPTLGPHPTSTTTLPGAAGPAAPKVRSPSPGSFHTAEVLPSTIAAGASKAIAFSPCYTSAPGIVTGLRLVSIGEGTIRATTRASDITPQGFHIHADNHCDQTPFGACASWLAIACEDDDLQHGTFSTTQDHPSMEKKRETVRRIVFERPYERPPQVVTWLAAFQFEKRANMRAGTWAQNVTAAGFDLYCTSGEESVLFSADVAWAACSADRPNMRMGAFRTSVPFPKRETGFVGFESGQFNDEPVKVFLAINQLSANMGSELNLRVSCVKVDKAGLSWYITTWEKAQVTFAGAAFIAMA
ncbi:hypothetical protein DFP73DRAFT_360353 [Morchella snyderi]|nr:hypothetical protein DFP73DRAFT_360353 [Morchella snyderi]